jgi:hypothetical protein
VWKKDRSSTIVQVSKFFYRVCLVDYRNDEDHRYLGTAFPVAPDGGLLTCRHVVDVDYDLQTQRLGIMDDERNVFAFWDDTIFPSDDGLDLAFVPNALGRSKEEFFPILTPEILRTGEDVYTFGFFQPNGGDGTATRAYLSGAVVNMFSAGADREIHHLLLPYAIIEGMSGSPVLTYHHGPKVVGLATGNRTQRVVAHEVMDYKDTEREYKETINRVVEFGVAYHAATLVNFLQEIGVSEAVVSDQRVGVVGLEG